MRHRQPTAASASITDSTGTITAGRRKSVNNPAAGAEFRARITESRAASRSAAVANRPSGDFARQRRTTSVSAGGTAGITSARSRGSSVNDASSVARAVRPLNAWTPASIS